VRVVDPNRLSWTCSIYGPAYSEQAYSLGASMAGSRLACQGHVRKENWWDLFRSIAPAAQTSPEAWHPSLPPFPPSPCRWQAQPEGQGFYRRYRTCSRGACGQCLLNGRRVQRQSQRCQADGERMRWRLPARLLMLMLARLRLGWSKAKHAQALWGQVE